MKVTSDALTIALALSAPAFGQFEAGPEFMGDGGSFGRIVAGPGDLDLDNDIGTSNGHVRVFSGSTGLVIHTLYGQVGDGLLGETLGQAGDVDGDGVSDLAVGQGWASRAFVFSGATGATIHALAGNPPSDASHDKFGHGASGAGDVDGDGFGDLVVGAFEGDDNGAESGSVYLLSGVDATGPRCHPRAVVRRPVRDRGQPAR